MVSGFFRPFVTPEWCTPGVGCFAIIVNNDNGASQDRGDSILYAGSGGRRRGQNRTAPQSFDQDWTNATNSALRLNFETGEPVRVVRGPKLLGAHGTAESGGGFRYDGLFRVASAEKYGDGDFAPRCHRQVRPEGSTVSSTGRDTAAPAGAAQSSTDGRVRGSK